MNEMDLAFDKGHLVGYREGQNDTLRGLNQDKPPGFWKEGARTSFVVALICWSFALAWIHYDQTMTAYRVTGIAIENLDQAIYVTRFYHRKIEAENEARIRSLQNEINRNRSETAAPELERLLPHGGRTPSGSQEADPQ